MPDVAAQQPFFGDGDEPSFMAAAQEAARLNGACVLEYFTCPSCDHQQMASHSFREVVHCGQCNQRMASLVPRLDMPGEVTKEMLSFAIRQARLMWPAPTPDVLEWIEGLPPAVKATCLAFACAEVHKAMDRIEGLARAVSGGHEAKKAKARKPRKK